MVAGLHGLILKNFHQGLLIANTFPLKKEWTLPVWVTAAAKSAIRSLLGFPFVPVQKIDFLEDGQNEEVPVTSTFLLNEGKQAFAISHCQSGASLDLTKGLEIWVFAQFEDFVVESCMDAKQTEQENWLKIIPGYGVGTYEEGGQPCLSAFAKDLLQSNLRSLVPLNRVLSLEIVFPRGKELAAKTSNASFGVVNGLALIGTQANIQDSASPQQLEDTLRKLRQLSDTQDLKDRLVFVIGENGLQLALQMGVAKDLIFKIGNWIGPSLVAAAEIGVKELLLFGYHGKLIKLSGGIFHTHHHLADGRLEILTALAVKEGLPLDLINVISSAKSVEEAFNLLNQKDIYYTKKLWYRLSSEVEYKSLTYLARYGSWPITIGSALFDRERKLRWAGPNGIRQLSTFGIALQDF